MVEVSSVGIFAAFTAGLISFLSPCVLPLVPGYVSYVAGQTVAAQPATGTLSLRTQAIALSFCFVLGFSTIFVLLGASATAFGRLLLAYHHELSLVGGAIVIGFGLITLGVLRFPSLQRDLRFHVAIPGGRPIGAYVLGAAFAFGWTPCIGPILGALLIVSTASKTVASGMVLLGIYSLGLGVPFVLAAAFTDALMAKIKSIGRVGRLLQLLAGGVMILMGIAMVTGQLSTVSFWLLETFPVLSTMG